MNLWQAIKDFLEYDEVPWQARLFNWHTRMLIIKVFKIIFPFFLGLALGYYL